jgi:hypothetical protein
MRSSSSDNHGDERGRDVVHDYVGGLPDDAAAGGLKVGGFGGGGGGWGEDAERIGVVSRSEGCGSGGCGEGLGELGWVDDQGSGRWEIHFCRFVGDVRFELEKCLSVLCVKECGNVREQGACMKSYKGKKSVTSE